LALAIIVGRLNTIHRTLKFNLLPFERKQEMKKIFIFSVLVLVVTTGQSFGQAGPNYVVGNITNYTSIEGGLLLIVDNGVPNNCSGTPYGWMIIPDTDKAMLAMAFMKINQENMGVVLYSNGSYSLGFCRVTQYDPR
jgi:hypothetical protein